MDKKKVTMQFINNFTIRQDNTGEPLYEFTDTQMGNFLDSLELKSDLLNLVSKSFTEKKVGDAYSLGFKDAMYKYRKD